MVGWDTSEPNAYGDYVRPKCESIMATVCEVGSYGLKASA